MSTMATFALSVGEIPAEVTLSGENGSCVDGTDWHSAMLKDKVYLLFYINPNKKDDNKHFIDTLHAKNYDREKYGSVAIINLKATWIPNFAIESKLKAKQEEFPQTTYVKDKNRYLVERWGMADDAFNVVLFDKEGKVLYLHAGLIEGEEMEKIFALIEKNL